MSTSNSISISSNNESNCCSHVSAKLKVYQALIFTVPIFSALILILFFYLFYLRIQRVDWSSLRMRSSTLHPSSMEADDELSRCELGLKKEVREMLPIIVFKEIFSVNDTQCAVCLGDYQADDNLQQIPACRHTFHMDCIDHWLATHNTCPLCRQSILVSAKASTETPETRAETTDTASGEQDDNETSRQNGPECCQGPQVGQSSSGTREETVLGSPTEESDGHNVDSDRSEKQ